MTLSEKNQAERAALRSRIEAIRGDYADDLVWGVRWDERADLPIGHLFENSRVWDDGEPTEETLDGTSAIEAGWLQRLPAYCSYFGTAYIVCGYRAGWGQDDGEVILRECEIMAITNSE